jgi:chromosome segregation protein
VGGRGPRSLPPGFLGVAVTRGGRAWFGFTRELRQAPRGGAERVLAERNRRDALVSESERAVQAEQGALAGVEAAAAAVQAADATRDEADRALRDADRTRAQAVEEERRAAWLIDERSKAPDRVRRRCAARRSRRARRRARAAGCARARRARPRIERPRGQTWSAIALLLVAHHPVAALADARGRRARVEVLDAEPLADREAGVAWPGRAARVRHRGEAQIRPPA